MNSLCLTPDLATSKSPLIFFKTENKKKALLKLLSRSGGLIPQNNKDWWNSDGHSDKESRIQEYLWRSFLSQAHCSMQSTTTKCHCSVKLLLGLSLRGNTKVLTMKTTTAVHVHVEGPVWGCNLGSLYLLGCTAAQSDSHYSWCFRSGNHTKQVKRLIWWWPVNPQRFQS